MARLPSGSDFAPPMNTLRCLSLLLLCLLAAVRGLAQVPGLVHYQGRIAVGGVNFEGTGQFKFALVSADGLETYWTNDGTASGEPVASVSLAVSRGLYSIHLGDATIPGMPPVTETVFQGRTDVRLRIWFDDGVHGMQLLAPDQRFATVPYAFIAGTVAPGALGLGTITGTLGCQPESLDFQVGFTHVGIAGTNLTALSAAADPLTHQSPYTLYNVPAGTHTVTARTVSGKVESLEVTVVAGQTSTADFTLTTLSCADVDGDGYGDPSAMVESCGYGLVVTTCTDTDDTNPFVHPSATEYCDGVDNNSDGNVDEACVESVCGNYTLEPGEQCDDGNAVPNDGCSANCQTDIVMVCGNGAVEGTEACDDGNTTPGDGCSSSCQTECTVVADCPATANVCLTAVCSAGVCGFVSNTAPCDDGNPCTLNDVCSAGACVGTAKPCSDGNPCTNDLCDVNTGSCDYVANTASCSDGDPCTVGDACNAGACQSGTAAPSCDDNNPCTTDSCQPGVGCVHAVAPTGTACDDNNLCTNNDVCTAGVCIGTSITCPSDGNVCTTEICNPTTGCDFVPNTAACNDANPCTLNDVCSGGVCNGTQKNCSDGNPCTNDLCDISTGGCYQEANTASCSDGNPCTVGDVCSAGVCQSGATPLSCDDGNILTYDSCEPASGCTHSYFDPTCTDGNPCTVADHWENGVCVSGPLSPCYAGVVCTNDWMLYPGVGYACGPCPAGMEGDGVTCTEINSCSPNPCFAGVSCTDVPAPGTGFICGPCPTGYAGDGITCTPL